MGDTEIWHMYPKHHDPSSTIRSPQLSTVSTSSEYSTPKFVYQRRKIRRVSFDNSLGEFAARSNTNVEDYISVVGSNTSSVAALEGVDVLKSESINGCSSPNRLHPDEVCKSSRRTIVEVDNFNDSFPSSKSNTEYVSASGRTELDTVECSSSCAMMVEVMAKDLSTKDLCICILKSGGLLGRVWPYRPDAANEAVGDASGRTTSRSCKICARVELVLKMLICDDCEEAFHVSCCNLRMKVIPAEEWFCHSCLKKHKILKEKTSRKSPNIMGGRKRSRNASSANHLHPAARMLRDNEPYVTGVRVGKGFQAEVPDWSSPAHAYVPSLLSSPANVYADAIAKPEEITLSSDPFSSHVLNPDKPSKDSSVAERL
ncbi:hypothetical protein K2173_015902 [Erythroxylum novogranatense]|uniref:PHD-type domain-containing protein n=1 Tax=Erythroxylum novogranatense TaxID=1862640 RepID=A0AAV8SFD7_9ROSI|nr:hypothetical protein K2173_015902 [Erythroxylum novogranatense]